MKNNESIDSVRRFYGIQTQKMKSLPILYFDEDNARIVPNLENLFIRYDNINTYISIFRMIYKQKSYCTISVKSLKFLNLKQGRKLSRKRLRFVLDKMEE